MALFVWENRFKTNISIIDEQHQRLVALLNDLHETMRQKQDIALIGRTINELVLYTIYHFQTEEELLAQYEYPYLNAHKAEHANLTKEVYDLQNRFNKGNLILTAELLGFLKDWVNDHILGMDKNYCAFLQSKGVR